MDQDQYWANLISSRKAYPRLTTLKTAYRLQPRRYAQRPDSCNHGCMNEVPHRFSPMKSKPQSVAPAAEKNCWNSSKLTSLNPSTSHFISISSFAGCTTSILKLLSCSEVKVGISPAWARDFVRAFGSAGFTRPRLFLFCSLDWADPIWWPAEHLPTPFIINQKWKCQELCLFFPTTQLN